MRHHRARRGHSGAAQIAAVARLDNRVELIPAAGRLFCLRDHVGMCRQRALSHLSHSSTLTARATSARCAGLNVPRHVRSNLETSHNG